MSPRASRSPSSQRLKRNPSLSSRGSSESFEISAGARLTRSPQGVAEGRQREREREREGEREKLRQVDRKETRTFFPRFFIEHRTSSFFAAARIRDSPARSTLARERGKKSDGPPIPPPRLSSSRCNTCASAFYRRRRAIIIRSAYLSDDHFPRLPGGINSAHAGRMEVAKSNREAISRGTSRWTIESRGSIKSVLNPRRSRGEPRAALIGGRCDPMIRDDRVDRLLIAV